MKKFTLIVFVLIFSFLSIGTVSALTASIAQAGEANILIDNIVIERDGQEIKRPIPMDDFVELVMVKIRELEEVIRLSGVMPVNEITVDRELVFGDSGAEVKDLQVLLNSRSDAQLAEAGPGSPGQETTYFGSLTQGAVVRFQASEGIQATGVVSQETMDALNSVYVR